MKDEHKEHMHHEMHDMAEMDHHDGQDMMNHGGHMMHMGNMGKKLKVSIALMVPLLAISSIAGFQLISFQGDTIVRLILGSIIFFYGGTPFFSGARGEFQSRKPAMMMLITMGIVVAYAYSVYATVLLWTGGEAMDFWFELSTLIVIMLAGHIIEMRAVSRAGDALKDLAFLIPKKAHLKEGKDVAISELQVDDILLVKENERIPADSIVTSETTHLSIDESMITGESRLVAKEAGDTVYGGSLNQNLPFEMKVTSLGKDSLLAQIAQLVEKAQKQKSASENLADRVAGWLFWAALSVGLASFIIWTMTSSLSFALMTAVSVFVIACPHALGLAVPLVVARLTNLSAKNGLLIQNRTSLESISKIKYALMDKTGTLTDGKFSVRQVVDLAKDDKVDILQVMAALESGSTHPIALSIVNAVDDLKLQAENLENIPGVGLKGTVQGKNYSIVSYAYLKENDITIDEAEVQKVFDQGLTVSFLLSDKTLYGFVALGDSPKEDAKFFIEELKKRDITPVMLTGDNEATAAKIAKNLGIAEYRAELKPEDKANIVQDYQEKGGVLFIGDGVNDSPALATSDLGIAIGGGTSVAINTADVVLVNSHPSDVLALIEIAKRSNRKMKQNLWFGAGYNIIAIPVAAGILYPIFGISIDPLAAAVLMSISTVIVSINAMGLKYERPQEK
ncbi:copper-translocating P-type ATPase [Lactococcus garvieae]|uniref:copper-translocating P-type ATPase n=1 Tax=Lactococcus garvieae TaxID=1363 RepID=UPI0022E30CFC|nr:copper-translocating P-type ATPase [Lactococcus garvieae]